MSPAKCSSRLERVEKTEIMNRREIEDLVKAETNEGRAEAAEARLRHLIWVGTGLFALFGIIVPLWYTSVNTERVDQAIEKMEIRYKELAGVFTKKPDLQCTLDKQDLNGASIFLTPSTREHILEIKNWGDGTAYFITALLYLDYEDSVSTIVHRTGWMMPTESDDPVFEKAFELQIARDHLAPHRPVNLIFSVDFPNSLEATIRARLRLYASDMSPKTFDFQFVKKR